MNNLPSLFESLIGLVCVLGGAIIRALWQSTKDLQDENKAILKKIGEIEVVVAGNYVKRDSFEKTIDALFKKVDSIHDKLDKKADK